jgi:hypothetical protein
MRAVIFDRYGDRSVLTLREIADPPQAPARCY